MIFLGLWAIGWCVVFVLVRKYYKNHKTKVEDDPCIDIPGMFDEVDYSERPFVNYN
jgi:hypothetical protein